MLGNDDLGGELLPAKVDYDQYQVIVLLAQESILTPRIERLALRVHIHQVEEVSFTEGFLLIGNVKNPLVGMEKASLHLGEARILKIGAPHTVNTPIIEYRCTAIAPREALLIHASLTNFLPKIEHERIVAEQSRHDNSRNGFSTIATKEIAGNTLLIVILKKIKQMVFDVVCALPLIGDAAGGATLAYNVSNTIIHPYLVIKIVKTALQIIAVLGWIIHFADKNNVREAIFYNRRGVGPKSGRHHLGHVAAKPINTLGSPVEEDVGHFGPCVRNRVKMATSSTKVGVVNAIVQLHGLIPVVSLRMGIKAVVSRAFCRKLIIEISRPLFLRHYSR